MVTGFSIPENLSNMEEEDKNQPLSRLKIYQAMKEMGISPFSDLFPIEVRKFILGKFNLIEDRLTDTSLEGLNRKISELQANLKQRLRAVYHKEGLFQKKYSVFLKGEFSWKIDLRDDEADWVEENEGNDKEGVESEEDDEKKVLKKGTRFSF